MYYDLACCDFGFLPPPPPSSPLFCVIIVLATVNGLAFPGSLDEAMMSGALMTGI